MGKQVRGADQAKVRQRKSIVFRMNFLFFAIFILFSLLILRLGYLQIVKSEDYIRKLERTEEIAVNTSVARGRIFDREGRILVDNDPKNAITYTKMSSTTAQEMLETSEKLAKLIEQDTKRTTIGDKRDFWILKNKEAAAKKVTKKEQLKIGEDSSLSKKDIQGKINRLTRERVTDEELDSFTEEELKVLAIYREMMSGYAYSPQIIKSEDVTEEEFAAVSERLRELPGVNTTTDWERVRKSSNTILGTTTNPTEGIPKSSLDYYLARDYSRNDRVGRSFIEQQYEELLQGQKSIVKNIKDRSGQVVEMKTIREGEPGKDLMLTIDSELQAELEEILTKKLFQIKSTGATQGFDRGFLVMLDPNNGEVLSLVGKQLVRDTDTGKLEIRDYAFGTFSDVYEAGSTVKMATVLTGYQTGAATLGGRKIDEMMQIGNMRKSSLFNQTFNRISVSDVEAIGRSSNVFMFKTAIEIGGGSYRRGAGLNVNDKAFDIIRDSFGSFGLGVKTGIDLPGEATGHSTKPAHKGLLLDLAIGQFDTYTTLQLAQYVSTIANGGYRIAPRLLKGIYEPSSDGEHFGPLIQESEMTILNRVNNTEAEINTMKKGMYFTYYNARGTANQFFKEKKPYTAAGKTGTAEAGTMINDKYTKTISLSHVGFAPYDKPEVAYAVLLPHVSTRANTFSYANEIVVEALDTYFALKAKNNEGKEASDTVQKIKPPFAKE